MLLLLYEEVLNSFNTISSHRRPTTGARVRLARPGESYYVDLLQSLISSVVTALTVKQQMFLQMSSKSILGSY